MTATSMDQTLVRNDDISISGTGAARTLSLAPVPDASGSVEIAIEVSAPAAPATRSFELSITAVNDPPTVSGQNALSTLEDTVFDLKALDLVINDPDDESFELLLGSGDNYTVEGTTVTPAPDFFGSLSIPVTVSDGKDSAPPVNVDVTVSAVNDPPVVQAVVGGPFSTSEDSAYAFTTDDFAIADADSDSFSIVVKDGTGYTADGALAVPERDFSGPLMVSVAVSDGQSESEPRSVVLAVVAVNDPPVIEAQVSSPVVDEDTPFSLGFDDVRVTDVDSAPARLRLSPQAGLHYTVQGDEITPELDFSGPLTVSIVADDGESQSAPFDVAVEVVPVNDAPVAGDDIFDGIRRARGNTKRVYTQRNGLLRNDSDVDGPSPLTAVEVNGAPTANGGAVDIRTDGSFTYFPPTAFVGNDSFQYTVTDGIANSVATATIEVRTPMSWFVDNRAAPGGDGSSRFPFRTLAEAEALPMFGSDDEIHVSPGDGTTRGYDEGIRLKDGQSLIGDVDGPDAVRPRLTAPAGTIVELANDNAVMDITVEGSGLDGITGANINATFIVSVSFVGVGTGVRLDNPTGDFFAIDGRFISTTGNAITISGGSGFFEILTFYENASFGLEMVNTEGVVFLGAGGTLQGTLFDVTTSEEQFAMEIRCNPNFELAVGAASRATFSGTNAALGFRDCAFRPTAVPTALVETEVSQGANVCVDIQGIASAGPSPGNIGISVRDTASLSIPGYAGPPTDATAAAAFIDTSNFNTQTTIDLAATSGGVSGESCELLP